jgi:hypothetical protein
MSRIHSQYSLQIPATLKSQLLDFRRRVWTIKMLEAAGVAICALAFVFLCFFALERMWELPSWLRWSAFAVAIAGCMVAPFYLHRWVWRHRALESLARLLSHKLPRIGDQLLGIIELTRSESEQARSRTLCQAAVEQVARDAVKRDLCQAAPNSRHRLWSTLSAVGLAASLVLFILFPTAAANSFARFIAPWSNIPRYTFAAIQPLPAEFVVPHGEPYTLVARLNEGSKWIPRNGSAQLGEEQPVSAELENGAYAFKMPSQIEPGSVRLAVGDWSQTIQIQPMLRPELTALSGQISLPDYLGRPDPVKADVRGGAISLVKGSKAAFQATANRKLVSANIDGKPAQPDGSTILTPAANFSESRQIVIDWRDAFGLAAKDPFKLSITARDDEPPTLACEDLPRQKIVLDSEQLVFKVKAHDDFGVKQVGMVWRGISPERVETPAKGEAILGPGGFDKTALELSGTFSAKSLGIEPQTIQLRIFAEDYLPHRDRVYSAPYTFWVLSPEEHAIWITDQLSRWHRKALEVRDRELQLYETNKQLRELTAEQLDRPENRKRVENQATAERNNGRRLTNLTGAGQDLLREAARNPEIAATSLESWAQMLGILKDISANRMPSVADLLKQGAAAPVQTAKSTPVKSGPAVGQVRASDSAGKASQSEPKKGPVVPTIADRESSQQPAGDPTKPHDPSTTKKPSQGRLGLPVTTLAGKPTDSNNNTPAGEKVDRAVKEQKDLLAEFQKVADELNNILANLEGSTLVKRLKAASRVQYRISSKINDQLSDTFGLEKERIAKLKLASFEELSQQELKGTQDVSYIMDDLQSYFERRRLVPFKTVLDDMRKQDVLGSLRKVADDLPKDHGLSMSQCEYWSDVLDRWAEDLVGAACCGQCNCQSRSSLPPAIVLEVLQILEGEVALREDTRVAEQAKAALAAEKHHEKADKLSGVQSKLSGRVAKVVDRIRELPDGEEEFGKEIQLLGAVHTVMDEATSILAGPETGPPAIAAETEAIELLLKSKRINPKGGGGGGADPGHGGGGTTSDSALALIGSGLNQKEVRDDRGVPQSLGQSGPSLPEEFRAGLKEYFNRLERPAGAP